MDLGGFLARGFALTSSLSMKHFQKTDPSEPCCFSMLFVLLFFFLEIMRPSHKAFGCSEIEFSEVRKVCVIERKRGHKAALAKVPGDTGGSKEDISDRKSNSQAIQVLSFLSYKIPEGVIRLPELINATAAERVLTRK